MKNYSKNLLSVASKTFAMFVIVSILLPLPVVNVVFAQVADSVVSVEAAPAITASTIAAPAAVSSVETTADATTAVTSEKTADVVPASPASGGSSNLGGGPTVCERVDANHDGVLNNADFVTFTALYTAQDPAGDFNQDGAYNVLDFQDFLTAFSHCSGTGSISICTRADMNDDGALNPADFTAFETAFNNQMPRADFDQNGFFNTNDFQAFTNAYAGCTHPILPTPYCVSVDMNNDGVLNAADFTAFEAAYNNNEMRTDFDHNGLLNANDFQRYMNAFADCGGNGSTTLCVRADMNNDGVLNAADFTAFETAYNNQDPRADFDLSGSLTANDFQSFLNAYASCSHQTGTTNPNGNITVSPTAGTTTETGGSVVISVALGSVPTAPVTIGLTSSKTSEGVLSTDTITLDASHMVQSFTVTGVDDNLLDGDQNYAVVFASTVSSDSNYNNLHVNNIPLVNTDNGNHPENGGGGGGGGNGGGGSGGGGFSSSSGGTGFSGGIGGGEVLGASTINPLCNYLGTFLKRGDNNNMVEVMKLQSFLKTQEGFSDLQVNGIFDDATFAAVESFQKKYANEVLAPWGYSADQATGYVYILTKNKVNELFCRNEIALTPAEKDEINSFRASRSLAMTDEVSKKKLTTL